MSAAIREDDVEQAMLVWLLGLGWTVARGPHISRPGARTPGTERARYREVISVGPTRFRQPHPNEINDLRAVGRRPCIVK
ncbi:MAG: hypothetical protein AMXMBFR59_41690 [Rhodanobacteraceae bacterium]|jgi:hypothetical protein|nr:hypothetical protein [Burkholderiaceae bacterium]MEB2349798.1 hypothetical protein [Burkholderiaceae bacterium]